MKSLMSGTAYIIAFLATAFVVLPWAISILAPLMVIISLFAWLMMTLFSETHLEYKVLIVDDDEISLTPMFLALQRQNKPLVIRHIKDSYEALETLKKEHFDLLILDYQMPGLSGDELLAEAEKNPEIVSQTSVVYYTSDIGFLTQSENPKYSKFRVYDKWAKKINYRLLNNKIESMFLKMA